MAAAERQRAASGAGGERMNPRILGAALGVLVLLGLGVVLLGEEEPPPPPPPPAVDAGPADAGFKLVMGTPVVVVELPDGGLELSSEADASAPVAAATPKKRRQRRARKRRTKKTAAKPTGRKASIMATIRANLGDVQDCYGRVALKDPTIAGTVVMRWNLGPDGKPTGVAVARDTLKDKSVSACIKQRSRSWRFPPPSGGVTVVTYPYNLKME